MEDMGNDGDGDGGDSDDDDNFDYKYDRGANPSAQRCVVIISKMCNLGPQCVVYFFYPTYRFTQYSNSGPYQHISELGVDVYITN